MLATCRSLSLSDIVSEVEFCKFELVLPFSTFYIFPTLEFISLLSPIKAGSLSCLQFFIFFLQCPYFVGVLCMILVPLALLFSFTAGRLIFSAPSSIQIRFWAGCSTSLVSGCLPTVSGWPLAVLPSPQPYIWFCWSTARSECCFRKSFSSSIQMTYPPQ